ncbi:hypothetical protein [Alicyclobacillus sacchari]|nr:hypothetical protein [Alicyclobacillus sacchari]
MTIRKRDHKGKERDLKIERYFNDTSDILFESILNSIIQERVEDIIEPSYHDEQPKKASSDEGVA